jgi:hypothetical protein
MQHFDIPPIELMSEAKLLGEDRQLLRRFAAGKMIRIGAGAYISTTDWQKLSRDDRYRARIHAVAATSALGGQVSHESAAALYRLPNLSEWSPRVHERTTRAAGGTSNRSAMRHTLGLDPHPRLIEGLLLTSFARTLVDVATTLPFTNAVAMLDDALRPTRAQDFRRRRGISTPDKPALFAELSSMKPFRGAVRALHAIEFADGGSGSPMESFSRVQFAALGYPPPTLQTAISDSDGVIGNVDFYWPQLGLVVEFDGRVKYGNDRQFERDVTPQEVLWQEKIREDRIRRVVNGFTRIYRETVSDRRTLAAHLAPFGLHKSKAWVSEAIADK